MFLRQQHKGRQGCRKTRILAKMSSCSRYKFKVEMTERERERNAARCLALTGGQRLGNNIRHRERRSILRLQSRERLLITYICTRSRSAHNALHSSRGIVQLSNFWKSSFFTVFTTHSFLAVFTHPQQLSVAKPHPHPCPHFSWPA